MPGTYLVVWTRKLPSVDEAFVDNYIVFQYHDLETQVLELAAARACYAKLLELDDLHIASITQVLESTDYSGLLS